MSKDRMKKIEEFYLQIFKFVVLIVLSLALVASGVMAAKGISEFFARPGRPVPARKAPKPSVDTNEFIRSFDVKVKPVDTPVEPAKAAAPNEPAKDHSLDDMVDSYLGKIWVYADAFQKACSMPIQLDEAKFLKALPRNEIKDWFRTSGLEFAESQDKFEKDVLSNDKVIQAGKEQTVMTEMVTRSLWSHRVAWQKSVRDARNFEAEENMRVGAFGAEESARVMIKKLQAAKSLMTALTAFGIFMSLALLLIFTKIETDLKGIKEVLGAKEGSSLDRVGNDIRKLSDTGAHAAKKP